MDEFLNYIKTDFVSYIKDLASNTEIESILLSLLNNQEKEFSPDFNDFTSDDKFPKEYLSYTTDPKMVDIIKTFYMIGAMRNLACVSQTIVKKRGC